MIDEIKIRQAQIDDVKAISNIKVKGWQNVYRGIIDNEYLDNMNVEHVIRKNKANFNNQNFIVAEMNQTVVGFCRYGYNYENNTDADCELIGIYVKPELKRNGIGSELIKYVIDECKNAGRRKLILWCLKKNYLAREFYEAMGGIATNIRWMPIGERIYLSPKGTSEEEIQKFTEWMNDFQITDYIGRSGQIMTLNKEKEWLENSAQNTDNRNFDIIEIKNDKLIGTIGLERFNWINRSAVLGIFIGDENFRNNGFGTEAINLLLEYGFKYLNLHSIKLSLLSVNERAHKCYLKCGFKDTGLSREQYFIDGKYYDKLYMDILESEFNGDYIKNKNI